MAVHDTPETQPIEVEWNGHDLPPDFAKLPPGRYLVEPLNSWDLTPEEEAGLEEAAASLDRGEGIPAEQVFTALRQLIKSKKAP